jgi:hypothetical protein
VWPYYFVDITPTPLPTNQGHLSSASRPSAVIKSGTIAAPQSIALHGGMRLLLEPP